MKVELTICGYIPGATTIVAEVPDDITQAELDSIKVDLLIKELEEDNGCSEEVNDVLLGEIVNDETPAELRVQRQGDSLRVEELQDDCQSIREHILENAR